MSTNFNVTQITEMNNCDEEKKEDVQRSNSWTSILIFAALLTTVGSSIPVGYSMGVINTPAEIIKQFCNESFQERYEVELDESSLNILWASIVSTFTIGGVIGSSLGGLVAAKMGRKGGLYITNGIALLGAIFFLACFPANSVEMLFIGRLLVGLAGGLTTSIVPMYLIEIAPLNLKGAMGVTLTIGITSGLLFSQIMSLNTILGDSETWHYLLGLFGILIIVTTPFLIMLPESPKFLLIVKDDYESAVKSLCHINKKQVHELSGDISDLCAEKEEAKSNISGNLLHLICSSNMGIPLLLVCFMQAGQQTSGINAVFYYSFSIFTEANFNKSQAEMATIGTGLVNTIMACLSIIYIARFGRKFLYITSTAATAIFLIALCFTIQHIESSESMPFICIMFIFLYIIFFQVGLGPISYFIGTELFEVGPRSSAMALGSICNWAGNFVVGMTFPSLQSAIGSYSFLFYALSNGLLCIFVAFYLPETKDKSPADIALHFQSKKKIHESNSENQ